MEARKEIKIEEIKDLEQGSRIRFVCQVVNIDDNGIAEVRDTSGEVHALFPKGSVKRGDYVLVNGKVVGTNDKVVNVESYKEISLDEFNIFIKGLEIMRKVQI